MYIYILYYTLYINIKTIFIENKFYQVQYGLFPRALIDKNCFFNIFPVFDTKKKSDSITMHVYSIKYLRRQVSEGRNLLYIHFDENRKYY